jgi:hypothetical protein
MYTIFLVATIGLFVGLSISKYADEPKWAPIAVGVLVGALFGGSISLLVSEGYKDEMVSYHKYNKREIYALQDNINTNGSFFLGSGKIDGEMYYYYYEKLTNGGFKSHKIQSSSVIVFEDQDSTAYIINTYKRLPKDHSAYNWTFRMPGTEIHVPKGSIVHDYNLDLK